MGFRGWGRGPFRLVVFFFVALFLAAGTTLLAQQRPTKIPPDFSYDLGKNSPGKVTFSHRKHDEKNPKCTACHTKPFKMKKGLSENLTMAAMDEGKSCGTCHNGKEAFATNDREACGKCHVQ